MFRKKLGLIGALCALSAALACSKSQAAAGASKNSAATTTADAASSDDDSKTNDPPLDCNKAFVPGDAAGILTKPATVSAYTYRPRSCNIEIPDGGSIKIYTGSDFTSEMSWNDVTGNSHPGKYTEFPGVGDRALYKTDDGTQFFSKKGKIWCTATLMGENSVPGDFVHLSSAALAAKLGALCTKVFAFN